ncbi:MAG: hypothetical protein SFU87_06280 [Chitinophagaceae bacterium]|nr:hypothetical protein [Chitinophagaceae bacterium]
MAFVNRLLHELLKEMYELKAGMVKQLSPEIISLFFVIRFV